MFVIVRKGGDTVLSYPARVATGGRIIYAVRDVAQSHADFASVKTGRDYQVAELADIPDGLYAEETAPWFDGP